MSHTTRLPATTAPSPAHRRLLREELPLANGVVQLGVGVAHLLAVHEQLKPLGHTRQRAVPAG